MVLIAEKHTDETLPTFIVIGYLIFLELPSALAMYSNKPFIINIVDISCTTLPKTILAVTCPHHYTKHTILTKDST